MDEVILWPRKSRMVWLLIVSMLFVALGLWLALKGGLVGYLCAGFFGLGVLVAAVQLLPGSSYLRLTPESMSWASLFRVTTIPWGDIDQFFVVTIRHMGFPIRKMVALNYVETYQRSRFGRALSSALADCESGLPDTYGMKAEELVDLLNEYLERFRQANHSIAPEN